MATEKEDSNSESSAGADSPSDDLSPTSDHNRVVQRAYERFQMRGGEHGRELEDWFEAERDLKRGSTE